MAKVVERLKNFRAHLNMSQKGLSVNLGISQAAYARYELGQAEPSCDTFMLLAQMGLNIHWLVTGTGDMLLQTQREERGRTRDEEEYLNLYRQLDERDKGVIWGNTQSMLQAEKYNTRKNDHGSESSMVA